jgi:hypothetical protein
MWTLHHPEPHIARGPFFHSDSRVDVAGGIDPNTPGMALGLHYDDWIAERDWLLETGIAFGYPPVPTARGPLQLVATVEVNAVVDTYRDRYVRFVVSGSPRGGFSGGPVFHTRGFVLGMIVESLEHMGCPEPGFFTVLSIEALHDLLEQHGLTPACQVPPTLVGKRAMLERDEEAGETSKVLLTAKRGILGGGLSAIWK